jgi:putative membrane protein insertion efficiency factor
VSALVHPHACRPASAGGLRALPLRLLRGLSRALVVVLSLPIKFYRQYISPTLPPLCRYEPSCSRYALEALETRGPVVGSALTVWRLCRCQPFGGSGYDPVPPRRVRGRGPSTP